MVVSFAGAVTQVSLERAHGVFHRPFREMRSMLPKEVSDEAIRTRIRTCIRCQKANTPAVESYKPGIWNRRDHELYMDFVTGFPEDDDGNTKLLVFRSLWTGRMYAIPCTECDAATVVKALCHRSLLHMFPGETFTELRCVLPV